MKTTTANLIKDIIAIIFIVWILSTPVSDWWVVLGIIILTADYKEGRINN